MRRTVEVVQDFPPLALVRRAAAMAFVYDDEVEEVLSEELVLRLVAVLAEQRLEERKVYLAVALQLLPRLVAEALAALEAEAVKRLVGKHVSVGDEKDAGLGGAEVRPLPLHGHQLVDELICDERLACASRKRKQHAPLARAELADYGLDRPRLIVANSLAARPRPRYRGACGLQRRPRRIGALRRKRIGSRELGTRECARLLRGEVNLQHLHAVRRVCEPHAYGLGIETRLGLSRIERDVALLRLHDGDAAVADEEYVVGELRIVVLRVRADAPGRDGQLLHPRR